jgi:hypothetical protein
VLVWEKEALAVDSSKNIKTIMDRYFKSIRTECNIIVDQRISDYYYLMALFWPIDTIVIGQSPYNPTILPRYAAALSFSPSKSKGFTPSVQVFSQFLCMDHPEECYKIANLLTSSYLLLSCGIFLINSRPFVSDNIVINTRADNACSKLLLDLSKELSEYDRTLLVLSLGSESESTVDNFLSSLPKDVSKSLQLRHYLCEHPASVARSCKVNEYKVEYVPSDEVMIIDKRLSGGAEGTRLLGHNSTYMYYRWRKYPNFVLGRMGKKSQFAKLFNKLKLADTAKLASDFVSVMQNRGFTGNTKDAFQYRADLGSYAEVTIKNAYKTSIKSREEFLNLASSFIELQSKLKDPEDKAYIQELLERGERATLAFERASVALSAVSSALTADTSDIAEESGNIPPIVVFGKESDVTTKNRRSAKTMIILSNSDSESSKNSKRKEAITSNTMKNKKKSDAKNLKSKKPFPEKYSSRSSDVGSLDLGIQSDNSSDVAYTSKNVKVLALRSGSKVSKNKPKQEANKKIQGKVEDGTEKMVRESIKRDTKEKIEEGPLLPPNSAKIKGRKSFTNIGKNKQVRDPTTINSSVDVPQQHVRKGSVSSVRSSMSARSGASTARKSPMAIDFDFSD